MGLIIDVVNGNVNKAFRCSRQEWRTLLCTCGNGPLWHGLTTAQSATVWLNFEETQAE